MIIEDVDTLVAQKDIHIYIYILVIRLVHIIYI